MGFQTLSPRKGIIPYPEGKKRLIRQPPHKKKIKKYLVRLDYFSNFADIYNKEQKVCEK